MMLFQSLEPRTLLAGNVSVKISPDQMRLFGDASANQIAVTLSAGGSQLLVSGLNGTTIDGRSTRTYAARPNYAFNLGGGNDAVTVTGVSGSINLSVQGGEGDDAIYLKRSTLLATDVYGDTGNDTLDITDTTFSKRLRVFAGEQDDVTAMRNVRARRGLEVTDTAGNSIVAMKQVSAGETSWFSGSGRRDDLRIVESDFAAFSAKLKDGNDRAYIRGTTFAQTSPIDGGAGMNDINREVVLAWDFTGGNAHGWEPGVESVPYDPGNPESVEELLAENGLHNAIELLTPREGSGILLSGLAEVSSSPPFLFRHRAVGPEDGVVATQRYAAEISVIAYPYGFAAFGTRLSLGAVPREPKITDAVDGKADVNFADSDEFTDPDEQRREEGLSLSAGKSTVSADVDGSVWLVTGVGLGGATGSTVRVFLLRVRAVLTPVS